MERRNGRLMASASASASARTRASRERGWVYGEDRVWGVGIGDWGEGREGGDL
jgi:hypothetical protein